MRAELLATSSLFWHATGYGEQARRHPERLEHFGITTPEAMLCGAVPLVVPAGGQVEIVTDGVNGRHWRTVPELVKLFRDKKLRFATCASGDEGHYLALEKAFADFAARATPKR